jgi:hypothetical protein
MAPSPRAQVIGNFAAGPFSWSCRMVPQRRLGCPRSTPDACHKVGFGCAKPLSSDGEHRLEPTWYG